ncbi:hypothetical protein HF086_007474 [Spodoptera exigua]|uniref:Peptidase A2 domain-containing protein n=1 Tax=Spodoptera exigua TaxID=7107 RepID=A0A922MKK3_SPOEX|nr:hypothetical protein HF086_007474 [Spodoptera exigua]
MGNKNMKNFTPNKYWCFICQNNEHGIYFCQKFLEMPPHIKKNVVDKNNLCYNCLHNHYGQPCKSEKRCRECNKEHNSILHEAFQSNHMSTRRTRPEASSSTATTGQQASSQVQGSSHVSLQGDPIEVLLPTAIIKIKAADGSYHVMRALLDQGSQTSLITENAAQILKLPRQKCKGVISGVGAKENNCKGMINIQCMSTEGDFNFETDVFIMKTLIKNLPTCSIPKPSWAYLKHIKLADPEFYKSRPVDILLGADVYCIILMEGICRENLNLPTAQQTRLGWILSGNVKTSFQCNVILNDLKEIERFWETEDITESTDLSAEDQHCIQFYQETTSRRDDGSYVVRIPFKPNYQERLGESKNKARAQFYHLERKFERQPEIAKQYKSFINEYLSLGHMTREAKEQDGDGNTQLSCYLPHHCVQRDDSTTTKLRVVFNASNKTSSGFSLNDVMCRGPNLQRDLQSLIIKWRQYKYAYTADIEKMFRKIWVHPLDQSYQKILWRNNQDQIIREYFLATVTYSTKSAPFLAMMTLKQLALDERHNYVNSEAPDVLEESFYMDDLLHGSHSVESAKQMQEDLIKLLKAGGFNLRKWKANSSALLDEVICDQENFDFKQVESTKTLGLGWNPTKDNFLFNSKIMPSTGSTTTKRAFLSEISKLYDPLGWISPLTIKLKILFQDVWKAKIQWDEPIPTDIRNEWEKIKNDIMVINEIEIPRWLQTRQHDTIELHGFSDASTKAYACVIYCRIKRDQDSSVVLVAGKTKLVSLNKSTSLPRLELSGAVLLSKFMAKIKTCLNNYNIKIFGWIDSMAVLGWLNGDANKWKPFVANRVKQVTEVMPPNCWQYIKSKENPADCASRGLTASQLKKHDLWWHGPVWLRTYEPDQEVLKNNYFTNLEIKKCKQVNVAMIDNTFITDLINDLLMKYSSMNKAIRIFAWINRIVCRKSTNYLSVDELTQSRNIIVKVNQASAFHDEINCLRKGQPLNKKSHILSLNPFLDKEDLLRVGGRLRHANLDPEMKHPLIIPSNRLAELIIDQAHETTFHGGAKITTSFIRQKYWLLGGNRATNTYSKRRHRRGLINGIGYVANSLFGVLDDQFAQKYEKDIDTIRVNENHLAELWKNQTSVVEAEFNLLKRTEDTMEHHHKLIHQKLNRIETSLNQIKEGMQNLSLSTDFIETSMISNNILFSLRNIQVTLLDTITNIYNGRFNFQLLRPEQLRHELNIISGQLPRDLSSPIDSFNLAEVYNLLQIRTRMSPKYLIIEIKIPLIGRDMYEIYRLIPIPYLKGNQTTTVVPISEYAAINLKKDALISISESDLKQCTRQNINLSLCYLRKPIYHIKDDQNLCERLAGTRMCKSTTSSCGNMWREINKLNEYFYFCCEQCHMKLLCGDQITAVQLTGSGLLSVNAGCIIKSEDFLVFAHRSGTSKIMISSEIEAPRIAPINHIINVSIPTSVQLDSTTHSDKQLQEIRAQIDIMKDNTPIIQTVSTHDAHHYAAIYIIIGVMLLTAIIYVMKRVRVRRQQTLQQAAAEASQEQSLPVATTAAAGLQTVSYKVDNQCSKCASVVQCSEKASARIIKQNSSTSPILRSVFTLSEP